MNIVEQLYSFFAGPSLYVTVPLCFIGLARKAVILTSGLDRGLRFHIPRSHGFITAGIEGGDAFTPATTFAARDMVLAAVTTLFHLAVIAAPLTARAHGILLDLAWGVSPLRFDPALTSACTFVAIAAGLFLLLRRVFIRHVRAASTWRDYAVMICVLVPFVTGLMARETSWNYEITMLVHCAGANLLLVAIGWTGLGHMVFFTIGRLVTSGVKRGVSA